MVIHDLDDLGGTPMTLELPPGSHGFACQHLSVIHGQSTRAGIDGGGHHGSQHLVPGISENRQGGILRLPSLGFL